MMLRPLSAPPSFRWGALAAALALCAGLLGCGHPPPPLSCGAGQSACGSSCVDLQSDVAHCGACGTVCSAGQVCTCGGCADTEFHADLVAACYWTGELVPVDTAGNLRGTPGTVGTSPTSLATYTDGLLVLDGHDARLYEASTALAQLTESGAVGQFPTQVKSDGTYAYVTGSGSNALDVFGPVTTPGADGFGLGLVGSLSFGTASNPTFLALVGSEAFVSLYGGFQAPATAGNKVARVDLADPAHPAVVTSYDLAALDLHSFDGGTNEAKPQGVAHFDGGVYVALNNLDQSDAFNPVPNGPGMLARIDVATGALKGIVLGSDCLNPGSVTAVGTGVAVVCSGKVAYSPDYTALASVEKSGLVLLDAQDRVVSSWKADCEGTAGCAPALLGTVAAVGNHLYVGDQFNGRMYQVDITGTPGFQALAEVHGWRKAAAFDGSTGTCAASAGPLEVCSPDSQGRANVADLLPLR